MVPWIQVELASQTRPQDSRGAVSRCSLLIATDIARSVICVSVCLCVLGTRVRCAEMAEPIEIPLLLLLLLFVQAIFIVMA